jgi:hypothetical protein
MQDHALCRKFLLDRTGHISSPFDFNPRPTGDRTGFVSRIARLHASKGGSVTNVMAGWLRQEQAKNIAHLVANRTIP